MSHSVVAERTWAVVESEQESQTRLKRPQIYERLLRV